MTETKGYLQGLIFDVECPYFACFRPPTSTSVVLTYPVPPFTTVRGMLANALGLTRNDFSLQDQLKLGLRPLKQIEQTRELAKLLKLIRGRGKDVRASPSSFPSSPMYRYVLIQPAYRIYVAGVESLMEEVDRALSAPRRPLYLGQSDDMVTISRMERFPNVLQERSKTVHSLVEGIHPDCELVKLPLRFEDENTLTYTESLSLPPRFPWKLDHERELYSFDGETVWLVD